MSSVGAASDVKMTSLEALLKTSDSVQLKFAALQLSMASANKTKSTEYMDSIKAAQEKTKNCSAMISRLNDYLEKDFFQQRVISYDKTKPPNNTEFDDVITFLKEYNYTLKKTTEPLLNYASYSYFTEADVKAAVKQLKDIQEQVATNTQTTMVYVQDSMGQYNSYLNGSNSTIGQFNQSLLAMARNI
jgi:hypothetical protein